MHFMVTRIHSFNLYPEARHGDTSQIHQTLLSIGRLFCWGRLNIMSDLGCCSDNNAKAMIYVVE